MSHWPTVALSELAANVPYACIGGPFGSELTTRDYIDTPGIPIIRGSNLGNDAFVDERFVYVSETKAQALRANQARPGDIVFTQRGTIGQVAVIPDDARFKFYVLSQSQMKLTPDRSRIDPQFLLHYFRSPIATRFLTKNTLATGVPHINLGILRRTPVPLPPLTEQKRIAAILDKADALRAKRRAALAELDNLTQSVFFDIFGDPAANPKGWPKASLEELFDIARGGSPRPIDDYITDDPNGINWIMIGDTVEGGKYITSTRKRIRPEGARRSRAVKPGDFLLTNSMSFGRPYIMRTFGCVHDGWLVLSPRREDMEPNYFYALLGTRALYSEFARRASGATVKNLNIDLVRGVTVPVPPLPTQQKFAAIIALIENRASTNTRALAECDELFEALRHRAFRGEL